LETGQETAPALVQLLRLIDRPDLKVNLDPGNILLYGMGDPVEAVRLLGPWICQVHLKDARRTRTPGEWGEEVPVGTGEVDWAGFFQALAEGGITCDLVIEREAGGQRVTDIQTAREFVGKVVLNSLAGNQVS
jgi:sugar phosphate isomerase/epimerase